MLSVNQLKALTNKRGNIKRQLTLFQKFVDTPTNQTDLIQLKGRLAKLEECWSEFDNIQTSIEEVDETSDHDHETERNTFETQYFSLWTTATQHIETLTALRRAETPTSTATTPANRCQSIPVKLPTINLPKFSGRYEDWTSFYDTFKSLIHENESLNEIQKLHYLKASLTHDAAHLLNNLDLTSNNYTIAIDILKEQFQNTRLIVQNHVKCLFDLKTTQRDSPSSLKNVITTVQTNLRALNKLGQLTDTWDQIVIHLITSKLDSTTHKEWEFTTTPNELPTLKQLLDFLQKRVQVFENIQQSQGRQLTTHKDVSTTPKKYQTNFPHKTKSHLSKQELQCSFCNGKHVIFHCSELKTSNHKDRIVKLRSNNICVNCLTQGHKVEQCYSSGCRTCGKKHHTLLHLNFNKPSSNDTQLVTEHKDEHPSVTTSHSSHAVTTNHVNDSSEVLLSTAVIDLISPVDNALTVRAFLDNGSQSSFVTESICQKLGLKKKRTALLVSGIGQKNTHQITHKVTAKIQSKTSGYNATMDFFVLPKITGLLPSRRITTKSWNIPGHVMLADPSFNEPNKIDVLLGQELFLDILEGEKIKNKGMPVLQKTMLGWILGGRTGESKETDTTTCHLTVLERVDQQLQRFWEVEEPTPKKPLLSKLDEICEMQYTDSLQRADDGKYTVTMPIKADAQPLGSSKQTAVRRFLQVERRLSRDKVLQQNYTTFMKEYQELGHMELAEDNTGGTEYFLPHHPVLKESSTTTKLRVVFDASAKTSNSVSLNDTLMIGPTVQDDLFSILLRFRTHVYVMSADIEKMYRQIWVHPSQRNLLKIIWRENEDSEIKTFKLKTVTYGTACASYLATRTLNQLAMDEMSTFPKAAQVVLNDFYVDDLLTGSDDLHEGKQLQKEIINLTQRGGFNLRKWNANNDGLLNNLPSDMRERHPQPFPTESPTMKALGVLWDAKEDILTFTYNNQKQRSTTKRTILSQIASLFDPLGLLSPIVIRAKIFLQELWKAELTWDENIPTHLQDEWFCFQTCLQTITNIQVPRSVKTQPGGSLEIHGFSDSSIKAFGAAVYIRHAVNNTTTVHLLCSKSRVAPVKTVSLPRLELCGALLLAELVDQVKKSIRHSITRTVYWTDSSIVVSWIASHASKWKTFVANRVGKIQELTKSDEWRHIRSQDNPADLVSRGTDSEHLRTSQLWWTGPQWLVEDESRWPTFPNQLVQDNLLEERRTKEVAAPTVKEEENTFHTLANNSSTLQRLQRTMAYTLRFIKNCRSLANKRSSGPLTPKELASALTQLIRIEQHVFFKGDLQKLLANQAVHKQSKLISLNTFLNSEKIICVGGRLQNSLVAHTQKHPIVLPAQSHLTTLIIRNEHIRHMHAGPQALLAATRRQFWPINARNIVRNVVHKCVRCFKAKPKWSQPTMGNLPPGRITPSRPFTETGIDYFGPVFIKSGLMRNSKLVKGYVCLFVCFATKAIHLELVSDMTTEAFLAAFKRFTSRRGICRRVYTDNGTNFVGANNELQELRDTLQKRQDTIMNSTSSENVEWHFIPPRAPHFGGLWEAGVKSAKYHLKRVIGSANLNFEQYYTTLTLIEACLNSRPLTPLSTDPNDPLPLTPGHFLTGDALTALPEINLTTTATSRLSHWQRAQQLAQHFWKRWSAEYLSQLQQRAKWSTSSGLHSIQPGQVVVVREDNLPPLKWVTAVVKELYNGADGLPRVATIQTATGQLKRPINRLCVLPTN